MFEIHIKPNTKLARNRVQLRNLVVKQIQTEDDAIAVYVDDKNKLWRFSFIAIEYKWGDDGIEKIQTASKRFTYLFGEGAKVRTLTQRFKVLNKQSTLEDLKTAFAVEQLNKYFTISFMNGMKKSKHKLNFPMMNMIKIILRLALFVF
ncbi:hypothetical protein [Isorropodon fossajaponicum symbiont]|uniref:hypothetical protein n=1 Tax=Isorropodon fossajaponicum symbiont TaxID=883811 RepID=UPI0019163B8B|nr:hypothetical protein [Isorropodon fossajaponicum symbiont]